MPHLLRLFPLLLLLACAACGDGAAVDAAAVDAAADGGDAGPDTSVDAAIGTFVEAATLGLEDDPPGDWYAGDVHVHATGASNDTGGDSSPEAIAAMAQARGLYFVVLTDHSNSTGSDASTTEEDAALFNMGPEFPYWDRAAELTREGTFLMIDGNEVSPVAEGERPSEPRGHTGCIPEDLATFDREGAFIDRPRGVVSGGDAMRQAKERGCFAVLNHPYGTSWTSYDWTFDGYDGMEVWNGTAGLDDLDLWGHAAWRCDLLAGKQVTPIGASDNHRVNQAPPGELFDPALGWPATAVFAEDGSWPAIMAGLRSGEVALFEGESRLLLHGYAEDGTRDESSATRHLRLRGRVDAEAVGAEILLTRATACRDTRPNHEQAPELTEDSLLRRPVSPGQSFDWAIPVLGEPGVYTAILRTRTLHYGAMSRAVVVAPE